MATSEESDAGAAAQRLGPTTLYQAAWHGSPHDFAKFSLDHVGDGEGAQAHGWGLYFAQNRETSERYRRVLTVRDAKLKVNGKEWTRRGQDWHDESGRRAPDYQSYALTSAVIHGVAKAIGIHRDGASDEFKQGAVWLERNEIAIERDQGILYHVDIPDEDVLLDEQKPLTEQPAKVQAAIAALLRDLGAGARERLLDEIGAAHGPAAQAAAKEYLAAAHSERTGASEATRQAVATLPRGDELLYALDSIDGFAAELAQGRWPGGPEPRTGREIYAYLERLSSARAASEMLNAHGVKGIAYDGRDDGRCFVIFDDQAIANLNTLYQIIGEQGAERLAAAHAAQKSLGNQRDRGEELLDALRTAKDMDESGPLFGDPKAIRLATGWEKGADGKWRYEIPDFKIRPGVQLQRDDWFHGRKAQRTTLGELLDAPELFAAYPTLAKATVAFMRLSNDTLGSYLREKDEILLTSSYLATQRRTKPATTADIRPEAVATLIHEIQHAIQLREGFAQGSNTSRSYQGAFRRHAQEEYVRERKRITARRTMSFDDFVKLEKEEHGPTAADLPALRTAYAEYVENVKKDVAARIPTIRAAAAHKVYRRVSGEVEARNVVARMNLTPEERRDKLLAETADVAAKDQIVIVGGLEAELALERGPADRAADAVSGWTTLKDGQHLIHITKHGTKATFGHEMLHVFMRELEEGHAVGTLTEEGKEVWDAIAAHLEPFRKQGPGENVGSVFCRSQHERLAREWEAYWMEGREPAPGLRRPFAVVKDWMARLYHDVRALVGADHVSKDVRGVFDRLLAEDGQPADAKMDEKARERLTDLAMATGTYADRQEARDAAAGGMALANAMSRLRRDMDPAALVGKIAGVESEIITTPGEALAAVDLTAEFKENPSAEEIKARLKAMVSDPIATKTAGELIEIPTSSRKRQHIVNSSFFEKMNPGKKKRHRAYLAGIERVITNAIYVGNEPNHKPDKKPNVARYHYFEVNVKIGNGVWRVNLVCEEMIGGATPKRRSSVAEKGTDAANTNDVTTPIVNLQVENVRHLYDVLEKTKLYQAAWHGSPHRFDRFSLDHVGNGEGWQAHGWGLYFSQSQEVAEGYRARLGNHHIMVDGEKWTGPDGTPPEALPFAAAALGAAAHLHTRGGRINHAIARLRDTDDPNLRYDHQLHQAAIVALQALKESKKDYSIGNPGRLYHVDVPEDDALLDEAKPYKEQPEGVQQGVLAAVSRLPWQAKAAFWADATGRDDLELDRPTQRLEEHAKDLEQRIAALRAPDTPLGRQGRFRFYDAEETAAFDADPAAARFEAEPYEDELAELQKEIAAAREADERRRRPLLDEIDRAPAAELADVKGEYVYLALAAALEPKGASLALNAHGVKGITYDGERDGRCFVVFDDKAIAMLNGDGKERNKENEEMEKRTYTVVVERTETANYEVEAETLEEAQKIAQRNFDEGVYDVNADVNHTEIKAGVFDERGALHEIDGHSRLEGKASLGIVIPEEADSVAYKAGDYYIEAHEADDGWDFTVFDAKSGREVDGGMAEYSDEYSASKTAANAVEWAADIISQRTGEPVANIEPVDYSIVEELAERAAEPVPALSEENAPVIGPAEAAEERLAYKVGDEYFVSAQETDEGWDYSIYANNGRLLDGGMIDAATNWKDADIGDAVKQALDWIAERDGRPVNSLELTDYDAVQALANRAAMKNNPALGDYDAVCDELVDNRAAAFRIGDKYVIVGEPNPKEEPGKFIYEVYDQNFSPVDEDREIRGDMNEMVWSAIGATGHDPCHTKIEIMAVDDLENKIAHAAGHEVAVGKSPADRAMDKLFPGKGKGNAKAAEKKQEKARVMAR